MSKSQHEGVIKYRTPFHVKLDFRESILKLRFDGT